MAEREVAKRVKNAVLYSDGTIRIDNVIASYPHLGTPYEGENDAGDTVKSFSIVSLLNKKTHVAAKDLIVERINALLKENKVEKVAADKKFIRDGDQGDKEEAEGHWTVSAREKRRPMVRDKDGQRILDEDGKPDIEAIDDLFYGGCKVSVLIRPWFQNHKKYGKRVNAGVVAVRFLDDGTPFGQERISEDDIDDMFDDVDDEGGGSKGSGRRSRSRDDDDDDTGL